MDTMPLALEAPNAGRSSRRGLDHAVFESIGPLSGGLALAAAVYGVFNWLTLSRDAAAIVAFNGILAVAFSALWVAARDLDRRLDARWANPVVASMLALCLANVLFKLALVAEPLQSTMVAILIVTAGCTLLSRRWLALTIATSLAAWTPVAWRAVSRQELFFFGTTLLAASAIAAAIHAARLRTHRRLEQAWAEARSSREYYRRLLSQSKDAVSISTPAGRIIDVNSAAIELFGAASKEEMLALDVVSEVYADPRERDALLCELKEKGFVRDYQTHLKTRDGRILDIEGTTSAMHGEDGQLVALLAILRDVTGRKQAEEALKQARDELEERVQESLAEKALLHRITVAANQASVPEDALEASLREVCAFTRWPVGHVYELADGGRLTPTRLWHFSQNGSFETFRRVTEQTRFAPGEGLPGRVLRSGEPAWIVDVTRDSGFLRARLAPDIGVRAGFAFPVVAANEVAAVLEFFHPAPTEADPSLLDVMAQVGEQLGRVIERHRAEEQRRQLEAQVLQAQKLESLGVLAGGIAHDFNNLLVAILGNAELARMEMPPLTPGRSYLRKISRATERAAELSNQMLAYSGQGKFVVQAFDLRELVEDMADLLRSSISKKAMLELAPTDLLPAIEADVTQIRQVVLNLITNASEALEEEEGMISVRLGAVQIDSDDLEDAYPREQHPAGRYVYLEVSDTGCGMDAETQAKIFDPFFTTKFTGRGLGMAAVLGIVRGHHGAIKIRSELGKGTTFTALFPASSERPAAIARRSEPVVKTCGHGTVLVVDDEESVRGIARTALEIHGFQVVLAEDGEQAIQLFGRQSRKIDAILLDLTMPHMNGEETFRGLRKLSADIKVVLMSGFDERSSTRGFAGQDLAGFLKKPFTPTLLVSKMRAVLGE